MFVPVDPPGAGQSVHRPCRPGWWRLARGWSVRCRLFAASDHTKAGDRYEQARAFDGVARLGHDAGRLRQARSHWQRALTICADLGVPEADDIHRRLAALDDPPHPPPRRAKRAASSLQVCPDP
jgi:hypothetical protein